MITAIFIGLVVTAVYRLFTNLEDVYAYGVSVETFKDPAWVKKVALMVLVPLALAFILFQVFKSKIKLR